MIAGNADQDLNCKSKTSGRRKALNFIFLVIKSATYIEQGQEDFFFFPEDKMKSG